ncbi:unnamed protein product [Diamesa serratosioi]
MNPLFACSKCLKRGSYEEIFGGVGQSSSAEQLCKDCRGSTVKCSYCRVEFQTNPSKVSSSTICKKCVSNVKQYGKPSACSLCKVFAAFVGSKCQRCLYSQNKYGAPIRCEICQQNCAFDSPNHKVDGKLHCWLCKLSYKRALAKAKKNDSERQRSKKRPTTEDPLLTSSKTGASSNKKSNNMLQAPEMSEKFPKTINNGLIDPNSTTSDHVVAILKLKETIAGLNKKLQQKDNGLLQKDKEITELKANHFTTENEMRNKLKEIERLNDIKIEILNKKMQLQLKEIAQLSKSTKRIAVKDSIIAKEKDSSGTESPNVN